MARCVDPFGASEYLVDDVAFRTMVGTDYVRFGFYSADEGENILRVKLVFPIARLFAAQEETRMFLAAREAVAVSNRLRAGMN